jgi:hypothetical protein
MFKKINFIVISLITLLLISCTNIQPVNNLIHQPIPKDISNAEVQNAILNAAGKNDWIAHSTSPGVITATYKSATITISYAGSAYNIIYKSSKNLNEHSGTINNKYNTWVSKLDASIQDNLNNTSSVQKANQPSSEASKTSQEANNTSPK